MKAIKLLSIYFILSIILNSCGSLKEAGDILRNEKTQSNNQFLIKKKEPLSRPPDFDVIPKPGSLTKKNKTKSVKSILKQTNSQTKNKQSKSLSIENSILNKIK